MLRSALLPLMFAFSVPALAAAQPLYKVGLETPVTATAIVKDVRWACAGTSCSAPNTATSPAGNVCASVARKFGRVNSFAAGEKTFDATQLEKCNAAAAN